MKQKTVFEVAMITTGISGVKLARALGVSDTAVSHWKKGRLYVPLKYRSRLCELLGVPEDELFDGRGIPKLAEEAESSSEI
ncbi:MAG: helix-turn-helix transcriptional regulator [Synergistales bacterium]|nr:helix-turn-helix transcriptional regulator [Synergistales bacterium]